MCNRRVIEKDESEYRNEQRVGDDAYCRRYGVYNMVYDGVRRLVFLLGF